ncbi:MAG: HEAT repeat domain-containing protein [Bacteroidota bacterium]|nr:HEAT repeat domain-containing protein [Bacteroidota bacterium]
MKCEEVESLMIEYLDNKLDKDQISAIEKHLETCESCLDSLKETQQLLQLMSRDTAAQPDESLRINFYHMLHSEIRKEKENRGSMAGIITVRWYEKNIYRIAAGIALLIAGTFLGMLLYHGIFNSGQTKELSQLRSEVITLKKTAMFTMLKDESSSNRIQAVDYANGISSPDKNIIDALVKTLNNDKNVNVRMAAAYALAKFGNEQSVRDSLVVSLSLQNDPILQVTLINILVELREKGALKPIEQIISNDKTMKEVKSVAENGVKLLI